MFNRLVIPAFEGRRGEPWIFKTRHHPDDKKDRIERIVRVALATLAAPTFFQALPNNGYLMLGGGLWSNNPIMNAPLTQLYTSGHRPICDLRRGTPRRLGPLIGVSRPALSLNATAPRTCDR